MDITRFMKMITLGTDTIYIAKGMPDINLLILNKIHILSLLECTVFCAAVHIFLCIPEQGAG
jgi:hypothetical protein